jgi:tetratricopeptide (TPR) repeat protein
VGAILLVTLAVYWQAADFGFIRTDDELYVYGNAAVKQGLHWDGLRWAFTHSAVGNWHPLTMLSLMLDYEIAGSGSSWFHSINIALHLAGTLCLMVALWRLTQCVGQSLFVGAVFALHPAHVESVAWISERKDVLSGLFFSLTLLAYSRYARQPGRTAYFVVLACLLLGLLSKPMLVSVPILLLLIDVWPLARKGRTPLRLWRKAVSVPLAEKLPLFVLAVIFSAVTFVVQRNAGAMDTLESTPIGERLINAVVAYVTYVGRFFWPAGLAGLYPFTMETRSLWQPFLAAVLLIAITMAVIRAVSTRPYLLVGWLWFVISLIPVIGLIQVGPQASADRYTYLPYIGLSIMLAWGVPDLLAVLVPKDRLVVPVSLGRNAAVTMKIRHWVIVALGLGAAVAMAVQTYRYLPRWQNDVTYWSRVVEIRPDFARGYYNLALAVGAQGDVSEEMNWYRKALQVDSRCVDANYGLANRLFSQGKLEEAAVHYQAELRINPRHAGVHNNLALVLSKLGRAEEAIQHYRAALEADPGNADALRNWGLELLGRKDWGGAVSKYEAYLKNHPEDYDAHCRIALALDGKGEFAEAIDHLRRAMQIQPDNPAAATDMGTLFSRRDDHPGAVEYFRQALQIQPDFAEAQYNLAVSLNLLKRKTQAIAAYEELLRAHPDHYWGHNNVGVLLAEEGKLDEAIAHFAAAIRIDSSAPAAQNNHSQAVLMKNRRTSPPNTMKRDPWDPFSCCPAQA